MCRQWTQVQIPKSLWWGIALALTVLGAACAPPEEANKAFLRQELTDALRNISNESTLAQMVDLLRPPKQDWNAMTRPQKRRHMDQHVMPVLLAFYLRSRGQREHLLKEQRQVQSPRLSGSEEVTSLPFTLNCKTCHGGGPADSFEPDFSKPSTLFPLDPNNMPTENDPDPFIAASVTYMKKIVTPAMAILLDRPNFSCFGCHAKK